ncbi:hypothetical protein PVOR_15619 [Paenibacillus vortex V453]|uniref:DUF4367 domain-containing protein n=1 Tax=Paenibacillus vortex V453 TaxID=715225 RepID=A0A2R9SUR5_9BACL|nr:MULTISPECIES: DUF4367 domain-containing protein [Paenibacillus]AWP28057.1 hypothetical protein B9D94_16145 [Paenibacillus sp. Cedars]EFU41071.1 hypothetical protein PVOR_15619 [Paenibacillus vortex V453]
MTSQEDKLRDLVKSEADEMLFSNLHFDSHMCEKVNQRIQHEANLQEESPVRRTRMRMRNHRWFAGTTAAAIFIGLCLFLAEPDFSNSPGSPPLDQDPPVTLMDPDSPIDDPPVGYNDEPRILGSYEEAGQAFGDKLGVPSYIPEGFSLQQISVTGPNEAVRAAVFSYTAGERSFGLFADKGANSSMPQHFDETVDVNGAAGYLIAGEPLQDDGLITPNVELHWYTDDIHFTISGLVSAKEALRIARSMEPVKQKDHRP